MLDRFYKYPKVPLKSVFIILFSGFSVSLFSQSPQAADILTPPENGFRCRAEVVGKDTFPMVVFNEVEIVTNFVFSNTRQREQWTRVKFNVKKVYPYAILAAAKLKEYDKALAAIKEENLRKAFIKVCEKDLRTEFEDELKGLTVSQGKILMKLIDRETEKTTYEIVKQLRGSFQAAMWQTVARIFGHNMKVEYDAQVEDIMIERAVKLVEAGQF
ncbi:hypothetical protein CNR22_10910 [Sphingobacteriaceae bacterium]|nr:hypothetical protein CNR22_10910 [Sphingobacteriaceae bacterium]